MVCMTSELSDRLKRRSIFFKESTEVNKLIPSFSLVLFLLTCPLR